MTLGGTERQEAGKGGTNRSSGHTSHGGSKWAAIGSSGRVWARLRRPYLKSVAIAPENKFGCARADV